MALLHFFFFTDLAAAEIYTLSLHDALPIYQQLDGAALQAYSQWRFDPRTVAVSQLKIPIEFANRPKPPTAKRTLSRPAILYPLLILLGFAVAVMAMRTRRRDTR